MRLGENTGLLFRALVMRSSDAATKLALRNNNFLKIAKKVVSVKNENAHCKLLRADLSDKERMDLKTKIYKYKINESILFRLSEVSENRNRPVILRNM